MTAARIRIEQPSSSYWKAAFDQPPINLITPKTAAELAALIGRMGRTRVLLTSDNDGALRSFDRNRKREQGSVTVFHRLSPEPTGMTLDD